MCYSIRGAQAPMVCKTGHTITRFLLPSLPPCILFDTTVPERTIDKFYEKHAEKQTVDHQFCEPLLIHITKIEQLSFPVNVAETM